MPLTPGTRLGPYEIVSPLGAGGMGEVYRAKDTRLGREVAIKVLPQHLSQNPEIRARFEREAKTVSGLNHPHICVLYDVGREADTDYLVMELIEGDTLAARLRRGPLPGPELLRLGTQIADALDRAHRAGVIHRDLKPANVMVTKSGAKLMDFGLSRVTGMTGTDSGSGRTMSALTQSPTVAQALTAEGSLLGTFQYMSPEQLEGREADARSDIWAFGCVLYEMATGRRAFEGRSQASLIAAILEREPPSVGEVPSGSVSQTAAAPPHGIERLIRNCLAKDPDERIQTSHDIKLQLQGIAEGAGFSSTSVTSAASVAAVAGRARGGGSRLPWLVAAAGVLLAAGVFAWSWPRLHAPAPSFRFRVSGVAGAVDTFWPRISPDGRFLLMEAVDSTGAVSAYVRPMDQIEAQPVPGTRGLQRAYWSPDGREIAFIADDKLQRVPVGGGSPTVICGASGGADLSWGAGGSILMDGQSQDSLRVVPAGGGELRPATRIDHKAGEIGSAWPCFLPDGKRFLFIGTLSDAGQTGHLRLGTLGSLDSKLIGPVDGRVEYAPGGWVLFMRGPALIAQKLDEGAGKLVGQPITLADRIRVGSSSGHYSISRTGLLAFSRDLGAGLSALRVADRSGAMRGDRIAVGALANPMPSPDGHRLLNLNYAGTSGTGEVHVLDLDRATDTRITFTGDAAALPVWSPDGRRIAYVTQASGQPQSLHVISADGLGAPDSIKLTNGMGANLRQWTPDGTRLLFNFTRRAWASPVEGVDRTAHVVGDSTQQMVACQLSPDGRWMAGGAVASGTTFQIFVQSLTGTPGRWQISAQGGQFPRWTQGGRELVYETPDGLIMAVDIDTRTGFQAGTPHRLFTLPTKSLSGILTSWGVDASGEHFYLIEPLRPVTEGSIEVVSGFDALVHRK